MAAQTDSITVGNYIYRVGDTIKVNNNIMYINISATSGNNVNMLTQCVMKIVAIYYNNGVGVTDVRNPIQLAWHSGPNGSYNGGGFIRTSQIVEGSGGTPNKTAPTAGWISATPYGTNATNNGWFEQVKLEWGGFSHGVNNTIGFYELWYQESTDGVHWSDRVRVFNVNTTATSGSTTIGSVNFSSSASSWGTRGRYYRWNATAVGSNGNDMWSSTDLWSNSLRKCNAYPVTFNANGGSGGPGTIYKFNGYNLTIPSTKPSKTGHTFVNWTRSGTSNKYNAGQTIGGLPDAAMTFVANYTANTYTITYNPNGGNGSNQTQKVTYGTNWTSKGAIYTRTGYTMDYWRLNNASTGESWGLNATAPYGWPNNITLYAHWKINQYTLTVNPNGGVWNGNTTTKSYTQNYNSTKAIPNPTRTGHTFTGWTKSGSGTLSGTTFRYGAGNCTLTANWRVNSYSITFNANGGSGAPGTQTGNYNSTITLSSTKPTRTGYNFSKWNTKANGTGVSYNPGTKINITGNMTLYAIWTAKTVKVTFYRNTSSSDKTTATQTFTYGVSGQAFSNKGWSRTGYTLLGWSENRSATTAQYSTLSGVQNSWINSKSPSVSIYAVWKKTTNIYVYTGGSFRPATPYIYTGGKWVKCTAEYVYASGGWKS